jgi:spore coat protein CotH
MKQYITAPYVFLFLVAVFTSGCLALPEPDLGDITRVKLYLGQENLRELNESVTSDTYTSCIYQSGGVRLPAALKVRGNISRQKYKKKSYALIVMVGNDEIRYALDGSFRDPSHLRNRLIFYAYREAGLPAPRTEGIGLFINDVYFGYYTKIERYSEEELNSHYRAECELFNCKFSEMGKDIPLHSNSDKKFPDDDNYTTLDILISNAKNMGDAEWNQWVQENADINDLANYLAVHNFFAVGDTLKKNFYICSHGKFLLLPWDNEHCMRRTWHGDIYDTSVYGLYGNNLLTERLLAPGSPVRTQYITRLYDLFLSDESTMTDRIIQKLHEYYDEIDNAVYYEPIRVWEYEDFIVEKDFLLNFLAERKDEVISGLFM